MKYGGPAPHPHVFAPCGMEMTKLRVAKLYPIKKSSGRSIFHTRILCTCTQPSVKEYKHSLYKSADYAYFCSPSSLRGVRLRSRQATRTLLGFNLLKGLKS